MHSCYSDLHLTLSSACDYNTSVDVVDKTVRFVIMSFNTRFRLIIIIIY